MDRLGGFWSALAPRQRLIAILATLAVLAAFAGLVQTARTPNMALLYSGLDSASAGEAAAAIEALGVPVDIRGNAIYVPEGERDRLRLALASQGVPKSGPDGYELLEGMDGFGTTSEMFEASYWRAKEGELARTILASPGVKSARVHIANPVGRPFQRTTQPSASVTVTMGGGALSVGQAEAIRYMVASAVSGLSPEQVSVIDSAIGAVLRMGEAASDGQGRLPGSSREAALRAEVERLLAARVGDGRAIVTISVDTNTQSETVVERQIDPDSRVPISSETRETNENASGSGVGGAATVASNLPQNAGGNAGAGSQRSRSETEERVNFEVSEVRREIVKRAGEIRRLTVAVLVDGVATTDANGLRVWQPRPPEELDQLRDLVRSAVGYNEERGDVVTVETLEFAPKPDSGVLAEAGAMDFLAVNAVTLIQTIALAAVALGLIFFVLRPLLRKEPAPEQVYPERMPPELDFQREEGAQEVEAPADKLTMLRDLFQEQKEDSANVLRAWLEEGMEDEDDHLLPGAATE